MVEFERGLDTVEDQISGDENQDTLFVVGTRGDDNILLRQAMSRSFVAERLGAPEALLAQVKFTLPDNVERVAIDGAEGNDRLEVGFGVAKNVVLIGGSGDDVLLGGAGQDWLIGDDSTDSTLFGSRSARGAEQPTYRPGLGKPGSDVLDGGAGNDVLEGGAGDDQLRGQAGDDVLYGQDGNDLLLGGDGRDSQYGGDGDDRIEAGQGIQGDLMYGEKDNDTIVGGPGVDVLSGGPGSDALFGGGLMDFLTGGADDDVLVGDAGRDMLFGEGGRDVLYAGSSSEARRRAGVAPLPLPVAETNWLLQYNTLDASESEMLRQYAALEDQREPLQTRRQTLLRTSPRTFEQEAELLDVNGQLEGLNAEAKRLGDALAVFNLVQIDIIPGQTVLIDTLDGGDEDDVLWGSPNADQLRGGKGGDTIHHNTGADTVSGGEGRDAYIVHGTETDDAIELVYSETTQAVEVRINRPAGDLIDAVSVKDLETEVVGVEALGGNDRVAVHFGKQAAMEVYLDGGAGDDLLDASDLQHDATLLGGSGNDTLIGGAAKDTLLGGTENDLLVTDAAGIARDTLQGEDGVDTLRVNGADTDDSFRVEPDAASGAVKVSVNGVQTTSADFETFQAYAYGGSDTLIALGVDSLLDGGAGDDAFTIGVGRHTVLGGPGLNNRLTVRGDEYDNAIQLAGDTDFTLSGDVEGTASNIWTLLVEGGAGNDTLDASGMKHSVSLDGGMGSDTLLGGSGDDRLYYSPGGMKYVISPWDLLPPREVLVPDSYDGGGGDDRLTYRPQMGEYVVVFDRAFWTGPSNEVMRILTSGNAPIIRQYVLQGTMNELGDVQRIEAYQAGPAPAASVRKGVREDLVVRPWNPGGYWTNLICHRIPGARYFIDPCGNRSIPEGAVYGQSWTDTGAWGAEQTDYLDRYGLYSGKILTTESTDLPVVSRDTTPPVMQGVPADMVVPASSASGAAVTFMMPTAQDETSGNVPVAVSQASGSTFALGANRVVFSAVDAAGNVQEIPLNILVKDLAAPILSGVPADLTVSATSAAGAVVNFALPAAADAVDAKPVVAVSKASGSMFPVGKTPVLVTATDASGNVAEAVFVITVQDNKVVIPATPGEDVIELRLGARLQATVNGMVREFDPAVVQEIEIQAQGGLDRVVVYGTSGDETATFKGTTLTVVGRGFRWTVRDAENLQMIGGGGADTGQLYDSAGADRFDGRPDSSTLTGPGYANRVDGFGRVYVYSTAGGSMDDQANLYDSAGADQFYARPEASYLTGKGFYNYVKGFDKVNAYATVATSADDQAYFYDSAGADQFTARAIGSFMIGPGYSNSAKGFDKTYAYATAGGSEDQAVFYDSLGADQFTARATTSFMSGAGFYNYARDFDKVYAYATPGAAFDQAIFYDSAGADQFTARPTSSTMTGPGYANFARDFDRVYAYATPGAALDQAYFYDSDGADQFAARPTYSTMTGPGYYNFARNFDKTFAYATPGAALDRAYFYDSVGADQFTARPTDSSMTGQGYYNYARSFDQVYAYATAGSALDQAYLYDSAGSDRFTGRATDSSMSGEGYYNYAKGFDAVFAQATRSATATDLAYLYDSPNDDELYGRGDLARLTGSGGAISARGFRHVIARSTTGGADRLDVPIAAVDYLFSKSGNWRDVF